LITQWEVEKGVPQEVILDPKTVFQQKDLELDLKQNLVTNLLLNGEINKENGKIIKKRTIRFN
jgi:hypothetical protein